MATTANVSWQPQEDGLREICGLIEQQISPSPDNTEVWQKLQHYSTFPDFNNYLTFIFAHAEGKSVDIRQAAGLLLKNNLRTSFSSMPPANQQYIKAELLPCLGSADRHIRTTAGTIITVVVQIGGVAGWPELLHSLVKCLDSNEVNHIEGAMDALSKICEDVPQLLDSDYAGLSERPFDVFLPRFLQLFQSPNVTLRKLSLNSVNQYIMLMPTVLYMSMDKYLQGLFILANDPAAEVRKLVCSAFVQLIDVRPDFLEPHLRNVIEYMLQVNKDHDDDVALEACEFWSAYCDAQLPPENLKVKDPPVTLSSSADCSSPVSFQNSKIMANSGARSFLQVAATEEVATPLRVVQIEGLVVLKIIKHCKELSPALVTGQLLGLDVGSVLEVTNCFPFPIREEDEEIEAEGANYQLEMMRCLREVNVDNNTVGWYQSTLYGSFQTVELIETFMNYQENIRRCVCIIYDPSRSNQGVLALKALKLSDSFMELYRENNFTGEQLRERNLSWVDIFEEIPIKVSNSALISAFMTELEPDSRVNQCDYDRLHLSTHPYLERNMEFLVECMDDLSMEQQKFQYYYRNLSRQQTQQQAWLQKRRAENMARRAAGEEPLPEEDPSNPIFKPIPEPSRLDSFLITNQVATYCNQINGVVAQSFSRLSLMKALHES